MFQAIYRPGAKTGRFLSALALSGISYGLYRGIQDNYLVEIAGISPFERGVAEFFRETPGLLVVAALAALYRFTESRIFKTGIAVMAAGLTGLLLLSISGAGKITVVVFMVVFSAGEHLVMPVKTAISLNLARPERSGASLGITSAISNLGNITGFAAVSGLFFLFSRLGLSRSGALPFKAVFAGACALMAAAVLTAAGMRETAAKGRRQRRFYFAKKFHKYYMLEVFYGARKQIFLTFAPYALILRYGADASVIALLMAVCALFGMFCGPLMGQIIDRLGYKCVMVADTLLLVLVCLLYGFAHRLFPFHIAFIAVCVNYVLDSVISLGSMASNVYVQAIASNQEEMTATLSAGVSVNHLISILIALTGGWIWQTLGIEVLFSLSAFLGILNSLYAATIHPQRQP
ncbi:MAG: MFS transporter [Spirochaetaceae bacterium]|jgi:predicted MFS family arabinose efflux permease|nr:MFS transporter [Spirochaetaceae bacterium]